MRIFLALLAVLQMQAQQGPSPDVSLLAEIRTKVAENLRRLPNYTCTQTIVRSLRRASSAKLHRLDMVHLDVVYLEGKELFGKPGSGRIDEPEMHKLVDGTVGNGDFALLPKNVFLGGSASFRYHGDVRLGDKTFTQFDYEVPRGVDGYQLESSFAAAIVGFHGSFWVDPKTLDLMRIEASADGIPDGLKLVSARDKVEFDRVPIGKSSFLLPHSAELRVLDSSGNEIRNKTRLQSCHEFVGESVLSFEHIPVESFVAPVR